MTWISNAESGSSVRAKLNSSMVPISSVTITDPVEYIDFPLDSGFKSFRVVVKNWTPSVPEEPAGSISFDGGTTWESAYRVCGEYQSITSGGDAGGLGSLAFQDSLLNFAASSLVSASFELQIDAGGTSAKSKIGMPYCTGLDGSDSLVFTVGANVVDSLGLATAFRLQPYGNADNPPTSGHTFTADAVILFGLR